MAAAPPTPDFRRSRWAGRRGALSRAAALALTALLGVCLGFTFSRYLLVGSGLSLVPWTIVALLIGYLSHSVGRAAIRGAAYGFALAFSFMCFGYQGGPALTGRLLPFALLGLVGAAAALALAVTARGLRRRRPS